MSERWPKFGSSRPTAESEASGIPSGNVAAPEAAVGVTDRPVDPPIVASADAADESTPTARIVAAVTSRPASDVVASDEVASDVTASDAVASDAVASNDRAEDAGAEIAAAASKPQEPADDGTLFLAELVRAMQTTAGLERARIGEDTDRRREAHIDEVRARERSEADRMRELAGEDRNAIEAWADGETKRIQRERERREEELNADLETSLAGHRAKIDREIERVEAAIATYRAEVDAFFEALDRETDPVLIAQQAARRPIFPKLEAVAETPSSGEPAMVGVMDADALARQALAARIGSWPGSPVGGEANEPAESVVAAAGPGSGSAGSLLETVPAVRPMSWLRRGGNGGDDSSSRPE
jgi:hypothetical protein